MKSIEKLAFFLIPLSVLFSSFVIIPNRILIFSLLLITLVRNKFFLTDIWKKKWWLLPILLIVSIIVFGNDQLSKEAILFLTIPIYLVIYRHSSLDMNQQKKYFVLAVFFFSFFLLAIKLINIITQGLHNFIEKKHWWNQLLYKNLSQEIDGHPTYLSMFVISSLVILLHQKEFGKVFLSRFQYLFIQITLLVVLFLFAVKIAYLVAMILLLTYLGFIIRNKSKINISLVVLFLVIGSWTIYQTPGIKQRMISDLQTFRASNSSENKLKERIGLWHASIIFIENNPVMGTSFMGISSKSGIYPQAKAYYPYLDSEKNCHNNFLEFGVRYGLLGFGVFLFFISFIWQAGVKQGSFEIIGLLTIITFFSLTESFMFRELGISFAAILMSIFGPQLYGKNI